MKNLLLVSFVVILISICLTGCTGWGLLFYNESQKTAEKTLSDIESLGVSAFNAMYTRYVGDSIRGNKVKDLYTFHEKNLSDDSMKSDAKNITIEGVALEEVVNTKIYEVKAEYASNGYINKITITEK